MATVLKRSLGGLVLAGGAGQQLEIAARDLLPGRRAGARALLRFAGPAVMASVAYMDPGNFDRHPGRRQVQL